MPLDKKKTQDEKHIGAFEIPNINKPNFFGVHGSRKFLSYGHYTDISPYFKYVDSFSLYPTAKKNCFGQSEFHGFHANDNYEFESLSTQRMYVESAIQKLAEFQFVNEQWDEIRAYYEEIAKSQAEKFLPETTQGDLTVTQDGFVEERWNSIENIPSRLLEVGERHVKLECVLDIANKVIETRAFPRDLLEDIVPFKQGYPVMIKIFRRNGEIRYKFIDGKSLVNESLFENDHFKGLNVEKLTKHIR